MFAQLVAVLSLLLITFYLAYLNMTISWGLEVKNWTAFVSIMIANAVITQIMTALINPKK